MGVDWSGFLDLWLALFDKSGRFRLDASIACRLEDMTAREYVESDRLILITFPFLGGVAAPFSA